MKNTILACCVGVLVCCGVRQIDACAQGMSITAPTQISNAKSGALPDDNSKRASLAPNADLLAYESSATNLDFGGSDTNQAVDIFLYNAVSSPVTTRESVDSNGNQTAGGLNSEIPPDSFEAATTAALADGKFGVAFVSSAPSLIDPPTAANYVPRQVYLRLPFAQKTIHISRNSAGQPANGDCFAPTVAVIPGSTNKFKVVYVSYAGNLSEPPLGLTSSAALYEATVSVTAANQISVAHRLVFGRVESNFLNPALSGNGAFLAFVSDAPDVVPGREIAGQQVYRVALAQAGPVPPILISEKDGEPGIGASDSPALSYTGTDVLFTTRASNLGISASASRPKYALYTDSSQTLTLVNQNANGVPGDGSSSFQEPPFRGALSADGRIAVFEDRATNLTTVPTSGQRLIFAKDLKNPTVPVQLVSKTAQGAEIDAPAYDPAVGGKSFSNSSVYVAFNTAATNIGTTAQTAETPQRVFRSSIDFPNPVIVADYPIAAPPDTKVVNQRVTFTFIKFATAAGFSSTGQVEASGGYQAAAKAKVSYILTLRGLRTNTRIRKVTTRNRVTIRKLKPDTYRARYRGSRSGGGSRPVYTKPSPPRTFTIR